MVKAHHVVHVGGGFQPVNPPGIARIRHGLPVVNGIAPELAVGGEAVRGAARHHPGVPGLVQLEKLAVHPHVRRIQGHINGYVADDPDALAVGVGSQGPPLLPELVLDEAMILDLLPVFLPCPLQRVRPAQPQILLPGKPGAAVVLLQSHEQGVIREPLGAFFQECFIFPVRGEPAEGLVQELPPLGVKPSIADPARIVPPVHRRRFLRPQKPLGNQDIQIDEVGISRPGGKGLVGGIPVARGGQGQNLPAGLACLLQKIYKVIGTFSHGAHAVRPGQGGDVH